MLADCFASGAACCTRDRGSNDGEQKGSNDSDQKPARIVPHSRIARGATTVPNAPDACKIKSGDVSLKKNDVEAHQEIIAF